MIFLHNKYTTWYYNIISVAKSRQDLGLQTETHHIIPKSFYKRYDKFYGWLEGNPHNKNNLVKVTPREHFILHLCLTKMTTGVARSKMTYAAWHMVITRENIKITSRVYNILRTQNNFEVYWWTNEKEDKLSTLCPGKGWTLGRCVSPAKNTKWWNNGIEIVRSVSSPGPDWKEGMLNDVWNKGQSGYFWWTDGTNFKLSNASPGPEWYKQGCTKGKKKPHKKDGNSNHKGTKWWTNGIQRKRCKDCPGEGWVNGSGLKTTGTVGMKWFNNGSNEKLSKNAPDASWTIGRL
jgi:hypothetical protein